MKIKCAAMFVFVMTLASSVLAKASDASEFVSKLKALDGRTGMVASSFENDSTGVCRIAVEESEYGVSVSFEETGFYFTPIAHITEDAKSMGENTLLVSTNPNRIGGDVCGDFGGAFKYKKKLSLNGREVKIEETFRCVLDGFKKYHLVSICTL